MNVFSLRTLIDDILLIVRNNNISESEDLSRAQIAAWVLAYKSALLKKQHDQDKASGNDDSDSSHLNQFLQTIGPLELIIEDQYDDVHLHRRRTKNKIPKLVDNDENNIYCVHDQNGHVIQHMNEGRAHFKRFRKYTHYELTYWYENGYIFIHGLEDKFKLKYIWVDGLFSDEDGLEDGIDEDAISIPGWMIPDIKKMILDNELSFMLNRISDDQNNSTLDDIKPQPAKSNS